MAKLLLLNTADAMLMPVECNELDDYYKYLGCDCFDVARRYIAGKMFDIFCDDCGLFVENPIISAFSPRNEDGSYTPQLVGNLIFANHDGEGNTTSLTKQDVEHILKNVRGYKTDEGEFHAAVMNVY